jgi:hypothetical protein
MRVLNGTQLRTIIIVHGAENEARLRMADKVSRALLLFWLWR